MSHMGIALGVCVILWSGATAGFGLYLQSRCARYLERGSASFFALSQMTYPNAAVIFDAAIAIKCFGVGVSYLIIIGDLMPGVVKGFAGGSPRYEFLLDRHFWVTAFMYAVYSGTAKCVLTWLQANHNTPFLPSTPRLPQVHQLRRFGLHGLLGYFGSLPLHRGRHSSR